MHALAVIWHFNAHFTPTVSLSLPPPRFSLHIFLSLLVIDFSRYNIHVDQSACVYDSFFTDRYCAFSGSFFCVAWVTSYRFWVGLFLSNTFFFFGCLSVVSISSIKMNGYVCAELPSLLWTSGRTLNSESPGGWIQYHKVDTYTLTYLRISMVCMYQIYIYIYQQTWIGVLYPRQTTDE